jgi:hypothetical protein
MGGVLAGMIAAGLSLLVVAFSAEASATFLR